MADNHAVTLTSDEEVQLTAVRSGQLPSSDQATGAHHACNFQPSGKHACKLVTPKKWKAMLLPQVRIFTSRKSKGSRLSWELMGTDCIWDRKIS
jgi:hypothetical protein